MLKSKAANVDVLAAVVAVLAAVMGSGVANAATSSYLDPGVQGMFTQLSTDFTSLTSYIWPVLLTVLGIFVAMKWSKRGASKL